MLKVSSRGEYGARLMVELGSRYGQGPVSLADVSEAAGLPLDYLEHLVTPLRQGGLVTSTRGVKGGYTLARPPREIGMGDVIRALEGPLAPQICAVECDRLPEQFCERESFCTTKTLWLRVRDSVASALDSTTLADLLPRAKGNPEMTDPAGEPVLVSTAGTIPGLADAAPDAAGRRAQRVPETLQNTTGMRTTQTDGMEEAPARRARRQPATSMKHNGRHVRTA